MIMQTTFAFDNFDSGLEYLFKVEYLRSQGSNGDLSKLDTNMTVRRSSDDCLNFHFCDIEKSNVNAEGLDKKFKAKIKRGKLTEFEDAVESSDNSRLIKQTIIQELVKDHSDIIHLPYTEVTNDDVTIQMPVGACKVTKLKLKTEESGTIRSVLVKSKIRDCVVSEEARKKMENLTEDDLTDESYNAVTLLFDIRKFRQIGVKTVVAAADNNVIESVFIRFVNCTDTDI